MKLTDLLNCTYVPRWGIVPMLRQQSVGEHTYRVMVIFVEMAKRLELPYTANDLTRILEHDGSESASGDVPGPFKHLIDGRYWSMAEADACGWWTEHMQGQYSTDDVAKLVKLCDLIETFTWIRRWGHGPQARRVESRCRREMDRAIGLSDLPPMKDWREVVRKLVNQIDDEEGRFGSGFEASS